MRLKYCQIIDRDAIVYYRSMGREAIGEAVVDHPDRGPLPYALALGLDHLIGYLEQPIVRAECGYFIRIAVKG